VSIIGPARRRDREDIEMKADIHPDYVVSEVTCACGETFTTRSTKPEIRVEICSQCHPFYTGKQKMVDTEGRVEKFIKRYGLQDQYQDELEDEDEEEETADEE
jgi:large subunit ribosomal protein L31